MLRLHKAFLNKLESSYFKTEPYRHDEPLLDELVELARGCTREGHTCYVIAPAEGEAPVCLDCGSNNEADLVPLRVKNGPELIVALFCSVCVNKSPESSMRDNALDRVAFDGAYDGPSDFETAYLFQQGARIRIVSGSDLEQGIIS